MTRLKELRAERNMKQSDLAKLLNLSPSAISNYEQGIREMDADAICKLCDIFSCTADYVLGRSGLRTLELTQEEESLLAAWRRCDDRAKDVVLVALAPFGSGQSQSETG